MRTLSKIGKNLHVYEMLCFVLNYLCVLLQTGAHDRSLTEKKVGHQECGDKREHSEKMFIKTVTVVDTGSCYLV